MQNNINNISCIIRFHDVSYISYLERALQSLHAQIDVSVKPIIVTQRFTDKDFDAVNLLVQNVWFFPEHQQASVTNYNDGTEGDVRSNLLNRGLEIHAQSENSFLAFLDYDDFLYSQAYKILIASIVEKEVTFAFGGIEKAEAVPFENYDFIHSMSTPYKGKNKVDLLRDNFCPLHSYVINTNQIETADLYFREDMNRVEDYEFLIRVAGKVPCDFTNISKIIGCYLIRSDGSNTTPTGQNGAGETEKQLIWEDNVKLLQKYKSLTQVKFYASDFQE